MLNRFFFIATFLFVSFLALGQQPTDVTKGSNIKVIGFYRGDSTEIDNYDVKKLTHLIFGFAHLQGNKISFDNAYDEKTFKHLVDLKKKHPALKVLVAIGGWGGCETCSDVFSLDSNRRVFVKSVKDLLVKYNADGIDLDWESPVIGGFKDHKFSNEDKNNFTFLIKELREVLDRKHEICFDANSFASFLQKSIDWEKVVPMVDWINLMTYSLVSGKSGFTGHHTPLYSSTKVNEPYNNKWWNESTDKGVQYLDSIGVPLDKVIIGSGFYAERYIDVDSTNHGLHQLGKHKDYIIYRNLEDQYNKSTGYEYYWDSTAQAPYMYNPKLRSFISYDNMQSVRLKTRYAIEHKIGGIMFWKLNGDKYEKGLLDAIHQEKIKRKFAK